MRPVNSRFHYLAPFADVAMPSNCAAWFLALPNARKDAVA
jgi:hypothetical protein